MATFTPIKGKDGKIKSYRALVRLKGHKPKSANFLRLTDAKEWAQNIESDVRRGRFFDFEESKRRTFSDLSNRYIDDRVIHFKSPRTPIRVLQWWEERIGHLTLNRITTPLIKEQWDALAAEVSSNNGKKRSNRTLNSYLENLQAALTVGMKEYGWLQTNPASAIKKKPLRNQRTRFLSDDERKALLAAVEADSNDYLKPVVLIALSTGARQGEIHSLQWKHVDFKQQRLLFEDTKNNTSRSVFLGQAALTALKEHRLRVGPGSDYVFPNRKPRWKNGEAKVENPWESIDYPFRRARDAAGLKDFKFHDLRHTAASYLLANGATLPQLAQILGHKTHQMVMRYSHLAQTTSDELVEAMTDKYFGVGT